VLDNNRLTTLGNCSLATGADALPPYLRTLSLVGNPLYCDCRLAWLVAVPSAGRRRPAVVWWPGCRGGRGDNWTAVVRHHSYYGLTRRDACPAAGRASADHCPFNL